MTATHSRSKNNEKNRDYRERDYDRDYRRPSSASGGHHSAASTAAGSSQGYRRSERPASSPRHSDRRQKANIPQVAAKARDNNLKGKRCDEVLTAFAMKKAAIAFKEAGQLASELRDSKLLDAITEKNQRRVEEMLERMKKGFYADAKKILDAEKDIAHRPNIKIEYARVEFGFGHYEAAIGLGEETIQTCHDILRNKHNLKDGLISANIQNILMANYVIADCYIKQNKYKEAQGIYQALLNDKNYQNDSQTVRVITSKMAHLADYSGDEKLAATAKTAASAATKDNIAEARELYDRKEYLKVLKLLEGAEKRSARKDIITLLLSCYYELKAYSKGLEVINDFRKRNEGQLPSETMLNLKMNEIGFYQALSDYPKMFVACDEALVLCKEDNNSDVITRVIERRIFCLDHMDEKNREELFKGTLKIKSLSDNAVFFYKHFSTAKKYEKDQQPEKATADLERLASEFTKLYQASHLALSRALADSKSKEDSAAIFLEDVRPEEPVNELDYCYFKSLLGLAINYEKIKKMEAAKEIYRTLLSQPRITKHQRFHKELLQSQAFLLEKTNDGQAAQNNLMKAMNLLPKSSSSRAQFSADHFKMQLTLARNYQSQGEYTQALETLEMLATDERVINDLDKYESVITAKARIFAQQSRYHDALRQYEVIVKQRVNSLDIAAEAKIDSKKTYFYTLALAQIQHIPFNILREWATFLAEDNDNEHARMIMEEVVKLYKPNPSEKNDDKLKIYIIAIYKLAEFCNDAGLFKEAQKHLVALKAYESQFKPTEKYQITLQAARYLSGTGKVKNAAIAYNMLLLQSEGNLKRELQLKLDLQWMYREVGNYERAEEILIELEKKFSDDLNSTIKILENKIQLYKQKPDSNYQTVESHYQILISLLEKNNRMYDAFLIQLERASFCGKKGAHVDAEMYFAKLKANPLFKSDKNLRVKFYIEIADYYKHCGKSLEAKECHEILVKEEPRNRKFELQLLIAKSELGDEKATADLKNNDSNSYRFLNKYYLNVGDHEKALAQFNESVDRYESNVYVRVDLIHAYLQIGGNYLLDAAKKSEEFLKDPKFEFRIPLYIVHIEALLANNLLKVARERVKLFLGKFPENHYLKNKLIELFHQRGLPFEGAPSAPLTSAVPFTKISLAPSVDASSPKNRDPSELLTGGSGESDFKSVLEQKLNLVAKQNTWERYDFFKWYCEFGSLNQLLSNPIIDKLFPVFQPMLNEADAKTVHAQVAASMQQCDLIAKENSSAAVHHMYLIFVAKEASKFLHLRQSDFEKVVDQIATCYGMNVVDRGRTHRLVKWHAQQFSQALKPAATILQSPQQPAAITSAISAAYPHPLSHMMPSAAVSLASPTQTTLMSAPNVSVVSTVQTAAANSLSSSANILSVVAPSMSAAVVSPYLFHIPQLLHPAQYLVPVVPRILQVTDLPPEMQIYLLQQNLRMADAYLDTQQFKLASFCYEGAMSIFKFFNNQYTAEENELLINIRRKLYLIKVGIDTHNEKSKAASDAKDVPHKKRSDTDGWRDEVAVEEVRLASASSSSTAVTAPADGNPPNKKFRK